MSDDAPDILDWAFSGGHHTASVVAALRLRVCTRLAEAPATSDELALRVGLSRRGTQSLLDALVGLGVVTVAGGIYRNTAAGDAHFVADRPGYRGDLLIGLYEISLTIWGNLAESVRSGEPVFPTDGPVMRRYWELFTVFSMGWLSPAVSRAVESLGLHRGDVDVLDLGGGAVALWGARILGANPRARVTQVDWPSVNALALEHVSAAGWADRFTVIDGDFRDVDLPPRAFDAAVVSNILHHLSFEEDLRLLARLRAALRPGGRLVVLEFPLDDDRAGPPFALILSIALLPLNDAGGNHTRGELERMVTEAGFTAATFVPADPATLLVARTS